MGTLDSLNDLILIAIINEFVNEGNSMIAKWCHKDICNILRLKKNSKGNEESYILHLERCFD